MNNLLHTLMADIGVQEAQSWSDFLSKNGGWGLAVVEFVIFGGVIVKLWMENKDLQAKIFSLLDKQNDIFKILTGFPPKSGDGK